ncbi:MAG TPA: hypothetical protein VGA56_08665 [Opitutaceae bacterium]
MNTFLKVILVIAAVLAVSAFLGCGGIIPVLVITGVISLAALGVSGLFTAITTVVGLVLGVIGFVVGLVLLFFLAPVLIPVLLLALPLIAVVAVLVGLFSACVG